MKRLKYRFPLCLSLVLFGTISLFSKNAGISSGYLSLCRAVIAIVTILVIKLLRRERLDFRKIGKDALWLLLSGAAMGFNWVLFFESFNYVAVSTATLCYYFAPILVTAACPFLFHEKLTVRQIVCFVMSTVGLVLLIGVAGERQNPVGICIALGSAVLYAVVITINKLIRSVTGIDRSLLQFAAAVIVLIPYVGAASGFSLSGLGTLNIVSILVIGIVYTGAAYCAYFSAIPNLPGQETMLLSYIDPLVAVIVSVAVLGEPITLLQLLGGALVIGFTIINELSAAKAAA